MNEPLEIEAVRLLLADGTTALAAMLDGRTTEELSRLSVAMSQVLDESRKARFRVEIRDTNARTAVMEARLKERGIAIPF